MFFNAHREPGLAVDTSRLGVLQFIPSLQSDNHSKEFVHPGEIHPQKQPEENEMSGSTGSNYTQIWQNAVKLEEAQSGCSRFEAAITVDKRHPGLRARYLAENETRRGNHEDAARLNAHAAELEKQNS